MPSANSFCFQRTLLCRVVPGEFRSFCQPQLSTTGPRARFLTYFLNFLQLFFFSNFPLVFQPVRTLLFAASSLILIKKKRNTQNNLWHSFALLQCVQMKIREKKWRKKEYLFFLFIYLSAKLPN